MGHPIWKYRVENGAVEAVLFPDSDKVPEGWHDSPELALAQPVKRSPGRLRKVR